jgi:hypothetical protein
MGTSEVIDQLSAVIERAWRTIFSGAVIEADAENAPVDQSGIPLPPKAGTATPYLYLVWSSGAYPGDKLGVTRRIWYTSTGEHVYKTAGQSTWRHSAIRPGVAS